MVNLPGGTGFLLLGSSEVREVRPVQAAPFLPVYPAAPTGNLPAVAALDRRLRAPVYFFLGHLSVLDLCLVTVAVPRSVHNSLTDRRSVSLPGRAAQVFSVVRFAGSELLVLTATSYDRYAAICRPLSYGVVVGRGACGKMAAASWLGGGLFGVLFSAGPFSLSFRSSAALHQFFCAIPSLVKASCSDEHAALDAIMTTGISLGVACLASVVVAYARIFGAVLRMPAAEGRAGAFSARLPRLAAPAVFFAAASSSHLKPPSLSPSTPDPPVSAFYAAVPPALNPLIYGLRNGDVQAALGRVLRGRRLSRK
uniref:Olfactory receptor n=1 Tax=Ornithorhynchus anatinus TaxID=9258 RepID=F7FD55_ORNAN